MQEGKEYKVQLPGGKIGKITAVHKVWFDNEMINDDSVPMDEMTPAHSPDDSASTGGGNGAHMHGENGTKAGNGAAKSVSDVMA
jgi:hypothetical protein